MQRKAFTLIELLVVIAIIAILAAILFPVFAQAKQAAKTITCVSGVKQIGTSFQMYLADTDDSFPILHRLEAEAVNDATGELASGFWAPNGDAQIAYLKEHSIRALLDPYIKNADIWKCASDSSTDVKYKVSTFTTSYPYRFYMIFPLSPAADGAGDQKGRIYTLSAFEKPANTWMFNEAIPFHDLRMQGGSSAYAGGCYQPTAKNNLVFLDSHAKTMPVDKTLASYTDGQNRKCYDKNWPRNGWNAGTWPKEDTD
ncbi:prepilin-type N-terminal cleavage/methylation domain-containing protein [bacterium]|nr:MAG: prepilin-type N-terminal cleavage/methylation domain-containing protein [bacterium]